MTNCGMGEFHAWARGWETRLGFFGHCVTMGNQPIRCARMNKEAQRIMANARDRIAKDDWWIGNPGIERSPAALR
jgi:hypothetical protein